MSHRVSVNWIGAPVDTLADLLPQWTKAIIVGVNPSPVSVEAGRYYQGQLGQRLWRRLERCGLLTRQTGRWEDDNAVDYGFGFTDVVKRPTAAAAGLRPGEREHGAALLLDKLARLDTKAVIFTFKDAAEAVVGPLRGFGWQDDRQFAGASVFVMPGPYEARPRVDSALRSLADRLQN